MRVSGSIEDVDYWRNHFRDAPIVYLNGERVDGVVVADSDQGYIVKVLRDLAGKLQLAEVRTEMGEVIDVKIAEKTFRGAVRIEGELLS